MVVRVNQIFTKNDGISIAVVIPAYRVERQISSVIASIPSYIDHIIVVDDASPDQTSEIVKSISRPNLHLIRHSKNMGVGGAMLTGYSFALSLGVDIVVKVDGDGQMDLEYLPNLIEPIQSLHADYAKGNRFLHYEALKTMPFIRKLGNLGLTFMTKLASGYWNIFDPTNGYTAISSDKLKAINPWRISKNYFFETSMLCELRRVNAVVEDIAIPAIYADEKSSINIFRELFLFSKNLLRRTFARLMYQYFLVDFTATSLYLVASFLFGSFGVIWGIAKWVHSSETNITASTGTVLLAVLTIILAVQFLTQAVALDITRVPTVVKRVPHNFYFTEEWNKLLKDDIMMGSK
jgi:glycosyltransferase involved in cell wall biosynthesis